MNNIIRVLVVDDHQMFLDGIVHILRDDEGIQIVGAVDDASKAIEIMKENEVDVLISDIGMPKIDGAELSEISKSIQPKIAILIVTMFDDYDHIQVLLEKGVSGYILKNTGKQELITAIKVIAAGRTYYGEEVKNAIMENMANRSAKKKEPQSAKLTKREVEIIKLIAIEHTTQEIADKLFISLHTVESHRKNILRKAEVRNMAGLIKYALKTGVIE